MRARLFWSIAKMSEEVPAGFTETEDTVGFMALVGPMYQRRDGDDVIFGFRVAGKHANRRGVVHGGMMMTFADHALGRLVRAQSGQTATATVSLNADFLTGPRAGDWVECRGRISRQTRSLVFVKGEVSVDGEIVMAATGVWKKLGEG
jgi:uncharacterized protein (TIGR00369 family)